MPRQKLEELDHDTQVKVKSLALRKLIEHLERNPHITEENLLSFFGTNRQHIYEECPWLRPENRNAN